MNRKSRKAKRNMKKRQNMYKKTAINRHSMVNEVVNTDEGAISAVKANNEFETIPVSNVIDEKTTEEFMVLENNVTEIADTSNVASATSNFAKYAKAEKDVIESANTTVITKAEVERMENEAAEGKIVVLPAICVIPLNAKTPKSILELAKQTETPTKSTKTTAKSADQEVVDEQPLHTYAFADIICLDPAWKANYYASKDIVSTLCVNILNTAYNGNVPDGELGVAFLQNHWDKQGNHYHLALKLPYNPDKAKEIVMLEARRINLHTNSDIICLKKLNITLKDFEAKMTAKAYSKHGKNDFTISATITKNGCSFDVNDCKSRESPFPDDQAA
jgi:hypothetical protein